MIGLADCNNFFVSCERSVNPQLLDKAVVVLSNNDGCVIARSNEAKRLGIKMGQPAFEIKDEIRKGEIIALSGNHLLYRKISIKVHDIIRKYTPSTIDYSIDESFLNMDGIPHESLYEIGMAIHNECFTDLKIPVTIGFAPSKTLAKIICHECKKKSENVGVVTNAEDLYSTMERLEIGELWGIGRRNAKKLYQSGIFTIADFYNVDKIRIRSMLGINGEKTWRELHGESCIELEHIDKPLQDSISESRTFPFDVDDYDYLRARISLYATHCAKQLRKMHGMCRNIGVFLRTNRFSDTHKLETHQAVINLRNYSDNTIEISNSALNILEHIYHPGTLYKRGGVWITDIISSESYIPSLFDIDNQTINQKNNIDKLMNVIDSINIQPASETIRLASQISNGHPGHNDGYSSTFQSPSSRERFK